MSDTPDESYEVGYKKPPKATRFKPGQSGNPSGKSKKATSDFDAGKVLQSIDNEEIVIVVDGKRKRMPVAEVSIRQLFNEVIKGDLRAARLIANMAAKYFGPEVEQASETIFLVQPDWDPTKPN